ncbi:MAG: hypothetical protein ABIV47_02665 [Roseiflexaceae bacterium]
MANNFGHLCFVVRDGSQFYISEAFGDSAANSFTLSGLANVS